MSWSAEAAQSFAGMLGVIQQTLGEKSKAKDEGISFCVGLTLAGRATVAAVKKMQWSREFSSPAESIEQLTG